MCEIMKEKDTIIKMNIQQEGTYNLEKKQVF